MGNFSLSFMALHKIVQSQFFFFRVIVTASESGDVKLWKFKSSDQVEIHALNGGENLSCMHVSPYSRNIIGTGGKKNDLQLWDLENPTHPVFKAKNVNTRIL